MTSHVRPGRRVLALASVAILAVIVAVAIPSARARGATGGAGTAAATAEQPLATTPQFHDSHFHLTNYIQEGITMQDFLGIMGTRVGRSTVFGIPLQQTWSYGNSGDYAPTYYLHSDAPLYYYSFTDAYIATAYRALPKDQQARFDPMIIGFNPADMYGVDHIKRVLRTFPGVFSGIGEFSIHKEFVSAKVAGETASLVNPALDRILDFAGEAGLVVILHNDIDMPFAKADAEPVYLRQTKDLLKRHPKTTIIWAHTGLGRVVHPAEVTAHAAERSPRHVETLQAMLADPALAHIYFDISWDEVAKYAVSSPEAIERVAAMINRYPDRFLFGTDTVAPAGAEPYFRVFDLWTPVWKQLTPETSRKVRLGNYERLFDEARRRVRAWEAADAKR
jgi:predicted TIM-barrel fold metal-dependent hydrolase